MERERLGRVRWPDEVPGSGWEFGSSLAYVHELVAYWRDEFDWRAQDAALNRFQQFRVPVAGTGVHVVHEPGVGPRPLPLLLGHGWPGSVWEFHELIPVLTDPARFGGDEADAFTLVAPSLPGYLFSVTPNQPRFDRVGMVRRPALDGAAARRPLRRAGGAGGPGRRPAGVLPRPADVSPWRRPRATRKAQDG